MDMNVLKIVSKYYETKLEILLKTVEDRLFEAIKNKMEERFEYLHHKLESEIQAGIRDIEVKFVTEAENTKKYFEDRIPQVINTGLSGAGFKFL